MLKKCFSLPNSLFFWRTDTCSNHPLLFEKYDKNVSDGLPNVCNVNIDDNSSTVPNGSAGWNGRFWVSFALHASLTSAFGSRDFHTTIFSETFGDISFTKALEKWLNLTNEQDSPLDGGQGRFVTSHSGDKNFSPKMSPKCPVD